MSMSRYIARRKWLYWFYRLQFCHNLDRWINPIYSSLCVLRAKLFRQTKLQNAHHALFTCGQISAYMILFVSHGASIFLLTDPFLLTCLKVSIMAVWLFSWFYYTHTWLISNTFKEKQYQPWIDYKYDLPHAQILQHHCGLLVLYLFPLLKW